MLPELDRSRPSSSTVIARATPERFVRSASAMPPPSAPLPRASRPAAPSSSAAVGASGCPARGCDPPDALTSAALVALGLREGERDRRRSFFTPCDERRRMRPTIPVAFAPRFASAPACGAAGSAGAAGAGAESRPVSSTGGTASGGRDSARPAAAGGAWGSAGGGAGALLAIAIGPDSPTGGGGGPSSSTSSIERDSATEPWAAGGPGACSGGSLPTARAFGGGRSSRPVGDTRTGGSLNLRAGDP